MRHFHTLVTSTSTIDQACGAVCLLSTMRSAMMRRAWRERNRRSRNRLCVRRRSRGRRRARCLRHGGRRAGRTEVRSDGDGLSDGGGRAHVGGREDVLGGHAPVRAASGERANVDRVFARQTAHGRRAAAQRVLGRAAAGRRSGNGLRNLGVAVGCAGAASRRLVRSARTIARALPAPQRVRSGGGADFVDHRDRRTGRDGFAFLTSISRIDAGDRRRHFGVDFVGRNFDERFVLLDAVADLLEPRATVPSVTVSPSCGIVIVVAIRTSPFRASPRRILRSATTCTLLRAAPRSPSRERRGRTGAGSARRDRRALPRRPSR